MKTSKILEIEFGSKILKFEGLKKEVDDNEVITLSFDDQEIGKMNLDELTELKEQLNEMWLENY
jgi:hypothetical protein